MKRVRPKDQLIFDDQGRPIGKYSADRELFQWQLQVVKKFLCEISKQKGLQMSKEKQEPDEMNMVWIAGVIKTIKLRDDGAGFILVDVGEKSKYIPCTIYDDKELASVVGRFREGDIIRLHGFVRAWSQKKDGEWKNSVDVRITGVKNKPPVRETKQTAFDHDDDGIPF